MSGRLALATLCALWASALAAGDPPPLPPALARLPDLAPSPSLFAVPPGRFAVTQRRQGRGPLAHRRIEFPSPYRSGVARNDRVYGLLYRPLRPSGRGVVILPIWKGGDLTLEQVLARYLSLLGTTALILPQAYQHDRAPRGVRSGAWTISTDLVRTRNAWIQSVQDVRRAALWLTAEEGVRRVGVLGVSLGGIMASLAYAVEPRFEAGVFLLAGGDLGGLMVDSHETRDFRRFTERNGVTVDQLRHVLRAIEPVRYADPRRRAGVLMVSGRTDTSIPPASARVLARAWKTTPVWIQAGHYDCWPYLPQILRRVHAHLKARLGRPITDGGRPGASR